MINRSIAPATIIPSQLPEITIEQHVLKNGVRIYHSNEEEELVRLSLFFLCGSVYSQRKGITGALSKLLLSGTRKYSAFQIQEKLDYYGAYTDIETGYAHVVLNVFCIKHHLSSITQFITEILLDLEIPEEELELYKQKSIESLKVNEQKTSYIARRAFMKNYFGEDHAYGRSMDISDYDQLDRATIQSYHQTMLLSSLDYILINTPVSHKSLEPFEMFAPDTTKTPQYLSKEKGVHFSSNITHPDAVQASIFLGLSSPTRRDSDFAKWSFLITLFGGYFGSRLMKNIREDKGYTYGISSSIQHYPDCALMSIRSDVKDEVKEECVNEIILEMNRLKSEKVSDNEMLTVKNYILGSLQRSFDGSLALGDRYRTILDQKLPFDYYHHFIRSIYHMDKEDIYQTANKYFDINSLNKVIVGNF
ncbi:MAG: insulinase family protein [Bacteroidota bacterium]|nr:insulinase family protein [Bacteroidota bacterium]MDX5431004.1 insulinase family protein [Bacteroidota bacterium]MDX5469755.1 insulinase family protein [Bacteroidota bacterium]